MCACMIAILLLLSRTYPPIQNSWTESFHAIYCQEEGVLVHVRTQSQSGSVVLPSPNADRPKLRLEMLRPPLSFLSSLLHRLNPSAYQNPSKYHTVTLSLMACHAWPHNASSQPSPPLASRLIDSGTQKPATFDYPTTRARPSWTEVVACIGITEMARPLHRHAYQ